MNARPILFSAQMVLAILNGSKTQTRRIISPPKGFEGATYFPHRAMWATTLKESKPSRPFQCGKELWAREAWRVHKNYNHLRPGLVHSAMGGDTGYCVDFRATPRPGDFWGKWRPSIYMPRWASRIMLTITCVRVERLQSINEENAKWEGIHTFNVRGMEYFHHRPTAPTEEQFTTAKMAFRDLWQSINGPKSWEENPWVWVISFARQ